VNVPDSFASSTGMLPDDDGDDGDDPPPPQAGISVDSATPEAI